MSTEKDLEQISKRLNVVIKLLAYQIVSDKTVTQGAPILKRLGLSLADIADIYKTTPNAIAVRVAESKRSKPKAK
jgi:hypothetical protein